MRRSLEYLAQPNWTWPGYEKWPASYITEIKRRILNECIDSRIFDWMMDHVLDMSFHSYMRIGTDMFQDIISNRVRITYSNHLSPHLFFN